MATARQRDRCRERLDRLAGSSLDRESLQREAVLELQRVIGFERWCWPLADPQTLLPGAGLAEHDYGPGLPRALELEYSRADFATKDVIAARMRPVGSLNTETSGDLAKSPRWDQVLRPVGIGDLAAVACRDGNGCWGWIEAYRDWSDTPFSDDDLALLADVGPALGVALRTRVDDPGLRAPLDEHAAGVLVLDRDLKLTGQTETARSWIELLPLAGLFASWGMLPAVVYPAAALARAGMADRAHALVPSSDGRWIRVEGAQLAGRADGQIVVTLREATPTERFHLFCRAHALSPRERQVVALVFAGLDTKAITRHLFISPHTVQDHLKSVFAKLGIHSRRELLVKLHGQTSD